MSYLFLPFFVPLLVVLKVARHPEISEQVCLKTKQSKGLRKVSSFFLMKSPAHPQQGGFIQFIKKEQVIHDACVFQ